MPNSFSVLVKSWGKENNPNSCAQVFFGHLICMPVILIWKPETQMSPVTPKDSLINYYCFFFSLGLEKPSEPHNQSLNEGNLYFSQVFLSVTKDKLSLQKDSSASLF